MLTWLERTIGKPTFGALVLLVLVIFFFGAATNTLSGWLYAMSGLGLAFLILGSVGSLWDLRHLQASRSPVLPTSVGVATLLRVTVNGPQTRSLLQIQDGCPFATEPQASDTLPAILSYEVTPTQRGIYPWTTVIVRSAAPLGLFWHRRELTCPAELVVYPRIWPLTQALLLKQIGQARDPQQQLAQRWRNHPIEGSTRSVRPYRSGDPIRWVHWRTSARLGQLLVRELEQPQSGQKIYLLLDLRPDWQGAQFELALEAVASLYVYGLRKGLRVQLLTPDQGFSQRDAGLSYLAQVQHDPLGQIAPLPTMGTVLWFSPQPREGTVWIAFDNPEADVCFLSDQPLGIQLSQASLIRVR